jgi:hypothetical protein
MFFKKMRALRRLSLVQHRTYFVDVENVPTTVVARLCFASMLRHTVLMSRGDLEAGMKAQDFKTLVEQLGDLSEVQRTALASALAGGGSGEEAIMMIDTQFAAAPVCGHWQSSNVRPWGSASGFKRTMCRDCAQTFNALTGTLLAKLRRRDAWLDDARALVDRVSPA